MPQFVLDERLLEAFNRHRIFFRSGGRDHFPVGSVIDYDETSAPEPYSATLAGGSIPTIGSFSFTSSGFFPQQKIGRYCSISWNVKVMWMNHPLDFVSTSQYAYDQLSPQFRSCIEDAGIENFPYKPETRSRPNRDELPVICDDVWIGQDVILARGITLGTGCVVAAGSVVTKSVPPYHIVGGNPARTLKLRFSEELCEQLLASRWWEYKFTDFHDLQFDKPEYFLPALRERIEDGKIFPFKPVFQTVADILVEVS